MRPGRKASRAVPLRGGVALLLLSVAVAHGAVRDVESLADFAQFAATIGSSPPEQREPRQRLVTSLQQGDDAGALAYLKSLSARQPAVAATLHETLAGAYLRERRLYRAAQHLDAIPAGSRGSQARYVAAHIAARQQRLEASLELLGRLARELPDDLRVARDEAQVASLLGRASQAAAACERVLRQRPGDAEAALLLARLRTQQARMGEAEQLLAGVLAREPRNGRAALQLGLVQLAAGRAEAARPSFVAARTLEAGNAAPYAAEAAVALLLGDLQGAHAAAAGARKQNPSDPLSALVEVLANPAGARSAGPGSGRFVAASLYPDLDAEPLVPALRAEIETARLAGRIAVANLLLEQLSPRAALDALARGAGAKDGPLAQLTALRAELAAGELAAAGRRLAVLESEAAYHGLAGPAVQSAVLAARRNDPAAARAAMARAVERAPRSPRIRMLAGDLYLVLGDPLRAVPEYRAALVHWPREPRLLNQLAHALAQVGSPQEREQALAYAETALAQQPHYLLRAAVLDTRADLLFRLGRSGAALAAYRELSTTVGGMTAPEQWHRLGDLALAAGDEALARKAYEEALDYGREYAGRDVAMRRIDQRATTGDRRK